MKKKTAQLSEFPKEVVLGVPVLTVTGQIELHIENYNNIIEYTSKFVRVRTKTGQIAISGENLYVEYYMNDEMRLHGFIQKIEYLQ